MKRLKLQSLCLIFLFLFSTILNSCKIPENILQSSSEVDFSTPQNVQITFNEHVYDTTIVFNKSKLEVNFTNDKDLLSGAYVCLVDGVYKITYKDMAFNGNISELSHSSLPVIIYSFILSFEEKILLDAFDKSRECYYLKKNVNGYFVTLECYESDDNKFYSMEIK